MQAYEIDGTTLRGVYATLASVFPSVEIWRTKNRDLLFVAGGKRGPRSLAALRARAAQEPYRTALAVTWRVTDVEGVLARHVASPALAGLLDPDELGRANTDDLNLLEFGFARGVSGAGSIDVDQIRETAAGLEGRWPRLDGPVDWEQVQDDEVAVATSQGVAPKVTSWSGPRAALARAEAAYIAGDLAGALREWQLVGREPRNLTELSMVAEAMAEAGLPASTGYVEALRPWQPIEADLVSARLHGRRGEATEAAALLEGAFVRHRSDPWPAPFVVKRALTLARELVEAHPDLGPRLLAALSQPFAVMILEEDRREAVVAIALTGSYRDCPAAFAAYEPHVPWRGKFLARRRECYVARRDPLAGRAADDLARFARSEPEPPFAP
jgi:hypothetical protein